MISADDVSSLDPSSINGLNLYVYCNNNPVFSIMWIHGFGGNISIKEIQNGNYKSNVGGGSVGGGNLRNLPALPNWTSHVSTALDLFSSFTGAIETSIWASTIAGRAFVDFHYAAYGIPRYDSLSNQNSPLGKAASFIGYGLIVAGVGFDIQQGYSFGKGATSAGLALGKDLLVMGVSSKVGGAVGAFAAAKLGGAIGVWAGPVGLIIRVGVGFAVGYVINEFGDLIIDKILGWFN